MKEQHAVWDWGGIPTALATVNPKKKKNAHGFREPYAGREINSHAPNCKAMDCVLSDN